MLCVSVVSFVKRNAVGWVKLVVFVSKTDKTKVDKMKVSIDVLPKYLKIETKCMTLLVL